MDRVRIGFIGCGGMARYHGRLFTQSVSNVEIAALSKPSEENLDRFVDEVFPNGAPYPRTFSDYRAMLEDTNLDGVVIVSPHAYHFQQAHDAISAGMHVLVEKPMVISTADAQKLIAHAD